MNSDNNNTMAKFRTTETMRAQTLREHVKSGGNWKTICVTTCLNHLGIPFDSYRYTSTDKNRDAWKNVVRKSGMGLASRRSELGLPKYGATMTEAKKRLRNSKYTAKDLFLVSGYQSKCAHLMVLDGTGKTIIDTAPNKKWRIRSVELVRK